MHTLQASLTIIDSLSKAPGNPVLWNLFLAELAEAMQCDSGFLSIVGLGRDGGIHYLHCHNVTLELQQRFAQSIRQADSFGGNVVKHPNQVFCSMMLSDGTSHDKAGESCIFGVSIPFNRHYRYCLFLNCSRPAPETELQVCIHRLQELMLLLRNVLQKEQWFSLYSQIKLITGKHVGAYLIVDRTLNVLFSDPVFERIILEMDCVEIRGKRLSFFNKLIEQQVLALAAKGYCDSVMAQNRSAACSITVIPGQVLDNLYAWEFAKSTVALVFSDCCENNPTLLRLLERYNLTKAEALCAQQFIATPSITDIAAGSNRSVETVRNHIKAIMHKLDVHNQGALMKKLLAIAAL